MHPPNPVVERRHHEVSSKHCDNETRTTLPVAEIRNADEPQATQLFDSSDWMAPDEFFTEAQICRLRELQQRFQEVEKSAEEVLTAEEYAEFRSLIKAELWASGQRALAFATRVKG